MSWTKLAAAALAFGLLVPVAPARADGPLVIRHGYVSFENGLSPVVFQQKAILKHYGTSYVVEPMHFAGTTPELTALAAGDVDIITCGFSTFASAVLNAHMDDIRIIGDGFQDGVDGYFSTSYLVRNDSGIKKIEDLKGKVMAVNAIGGALDVALRAMMRQHGMEDQRDYSEVEAQFGPMVAMLSEKKVDLIGEIPSYMIDPRIVKDAHVLFTGKDAVGPTQQIVYAAKAGFLAKNHAALNDFFEDEVRGVRWFLDPANRTEAIAIIAKAMKVPPSRYSPFLFTKQDFYRDPNSRPNLDALQHDMETERKLGFFKASIDVKKYADLSFIDEAAKRLK